ncbi:MAG: glycosyltransferase family 4 protein [Clostridia bacterium]
MRVLFDATIYERQPAGIGHYVDHLLRHYVSCFPEDSVRTLTRDGVTWPGAESIPILAADGGSLARLRVEQTRLPSLARALDYDVVHFPDYRCPLRTPPHSLVTIHDLAVFRFPETFTPNQRRIKRWFTRQSIRRAQRIIVPSRATRDDLVNLLGCDAAKIQVVPMGVDPPSQASYSDGATPHPRPYFLFVGTLEPRKNLLRIVEAMDIVRRRAPDAPDLVVIGKKGWLYEDIFREVERRKLQDRVIFLGYVPGDDLGQWYRAAVGLCFPTRYEGFGFPVLEAMAAGCPVVTSDRGAVREVAEGAALLVDPDEPEAIAEALLRLFHDGGLSGDLVQRGRECARQYSWDRTARETRAAYEQVLTGD